MKINDTKFSIPRNEIRYKFLRFHLWYSPGDLVPRDWNAIQIGMMLERAFIAPIEPFASTHGVRK